MGKFSNPRSGNVSNPETELEQMPYGAVNESPRKKGKVLLITLCAVVAVLLIAVIAGLWFIVGDGALGGRILENVDVAGVDIGGMTKEEAAAALESSLAADIAQDMVIDLPDTTLTLPAADAGVALDIEAAVDAAYQYGRDGSWSENKQVRDNAANSSFTVELADCLLLNEEYIRQELNAYCTGYNSDFAQSTVNIDGDMPVLDTSDENFDPDASCQTVTVYTGMPGRYIDPEALYTQVAEAYSQQIFGITAEIGAEETLPDALEEQLQEVYELYAAEPADSVFDTETYEPLGEIYGYTFDLDAALAQISEADFGETIEIKFHLVQPEVTKETLEAMLFRDELASYETKHTNNSNRNNNLTLACAAINGKVLMPGEQFDYNTTLGKRTTEAGYKAADAYSGGKTVQTVGGGICQVSSTLYYCTLIADLQIDSRTAHSYTSSYMPLGMDATVSWGGPEFRFTNNTNYPIRIEAEVSGGYVKVKLIGTDEKDYYVEMEYEVLSNTYASTVTEDYPADNKEGYKDGQVLQTAYNGCTVQSYKCKYDKETGELISREKEALSKYKSRDKIVVHIVTEEETAPPTEATEAPATEPTAEETAPPETSAPEDSGDSAE